MWPRDHRVKSAKFGDHKVQSNNFVTKCNRLLLHSASGMTKYDRVMLQSASDIMKGHILYCKVRQIS